MQQVYATANCLLYQKGVRNDNLDKLVSTTIFPPGDRCSLCSIETGEAGRDGYGVIRLDASLRLNMDTRIVELRPGAEKSGKVACCHELSVPASVRVEAM